MRGVSNCVNTLILVSQNTTLLRYIIGRGKGLSMRSYLIVIIGFILLKTISLSADDGAENQFLYSLNYTNTRINTALETLTQRIEAAHHQLEKYAPRCYATLATLSYIMIPTIIFLIKIVKIKTDTKLVLRPSAVMQESVT